MGAVCVGDIVEAAESGGEVCDWEAGGLPPSSIRSSAHSHEIRYLDSIAWKAEVSCRRFEASFIAYAEDPARGFVFEREREGGRAILKNVGEVARDCSGGAVLTKIVWTSLINELYAACNSLSSEGIRH